MQECLEKDIHPHPNPTSYHRPASGHPSRSPEKTMSKEIKKAVILTILGAWVLLFGVHAAEAFGELQDTSEYSGQNIEHFLSTPADHPALISYKIERPLLSIQWVNEAPSCCEISRHGLFHLNFLSGHSPPETRPKLFQLFSNYRL